jgi:hypothetical protein
MTICNDIADQLISRATEQLEGCSVLVMIRHRTKEGFEANTRWHGDLYVCYGMAKSFTLVRAKYFSELSEAPDS